MKQQATTLKTAALLCGLSSMALAGEPMAQAPAEPSAAPFDFCSWLSSKPGTLYKDATNPWISELQISGRFHYNAAYVDGQGADGKDWNEAYSEVRRFRLGGKISFLEYFTLKGAVNLVDDQRSNGSAVKEAQDLNWGYEDVDEATLSFNAKKAFGIEDVDGLNLIYGRFKWHGGLEARTSSNDLLTVERSALSNKLYDSARPTGFAVNVVKGNWNVTSGIYSSDGREPDTDLGENFNNRNNNEFLSGWHDDLMFNTEVIYTANEDLRFGWEFLYNDADKYSNHFATGNDNLLPYKWASTLSAEYTVNRFGLNSELFYGDNGNIDDHKTKGEYDRRGMFGGVVLTPYYWIVPAKLQAVVQYMYAGSEDGQGIRTNSRYFRGSKNVDNTGKAGAATAGDVNGGRGDALHTVYAGLNYLVCGDNLKFQAGVEYTNLNTPLYKEGDASAFTYLFGFRTNF
ncbi:MAG TPA: hypothetical protein VIM46_06175 [Luteolibacter sp.]